MAFERNLPDSRFLTPRVEGEYKVLIPSDVIGRELLIGREQENSRAYQRRLKYMPETPGYKAESLVKRYQQERFLDELVDLAVEGAIIRSEYEHAVAAAIGGTVSSAISKQADKGFISGVLTSPVAALGLIVDIGRNSVDAVAGVNEAHQKMSREYYRRAAEYITVHSSIMKSERRNWLSWSAADVDRAYLSTNRIEWFGHGEALVGLHLEINHAIAGMNKAKAEGRALAEGRIKRQAIDIASPFIDGFVSKILPSGHKPK
ncbi:MAG TPA: hypothetical protein PKA63_05970 [Oligoflexia bacterium]|nr:hypothetical protein [Oligoflexia bacterium]HMP48197.1 hypothetical protein [Oligoflexia bacterium]